MAEPALQITAPELLALGEAWQRARVVLRAKVGDEVFTSWFARMQLDAVDDDAAGEGLARLSVPTRFLKSWIQAHYTERLLDSLKAARPDIRRIEIAVRSPILRTNTRAKPSPMPASQAPSVPSAAVGVGTSQGVPAGWPAPSSSRDGLGGSPLDPRFSFDTFVVGRSNTLALAAARQEASARADERVMFNPLYLHAGVGLGKTHLLQAIAWGAGDGRKVLYLTVEKFIYGFVAALESRDAGAPAAFTERLRGVDVLAIDDLQFLQGKATMVEFANAFNALIEGDRQVVVAADRPPSELEQFDERSRSRLSGGLTVEIGAQDGELRLDILKTRVAAAQRHHPDFAVPADVLAFVANAVAHNGRDLEGAINRLIAHRTFTGAPITLEMAASAVRDLVRTADPKRVKIEDIQRVVARQYNVSRADLLSPRRAASVVRPRQLAMYLAKALTMRSLPEIGRRFGGRDHTTVLHAVRKIETLASNDATLAEEIDLLKRILLEP
jgi:chromosomal replication initiator protein